MQADVEIRLRVVRTQPQAAITIWAFNNNAATGRASQDIFSLVASLTLPRGVSGQLSRFRGSWGRMNYGLQERMECTMAFA